ncbi:phage tail tape measure protein [Nitrobacter hamburgensis]|uniref:phage tail tape measure protein n=1 Tax=Nitrobacter hamburgensis TaxID=912 RepID=UPI0000555A01|nr:phage tail tape measure protein [Nitrobacter hamburgensis]
MADVNKVTNFSADGLKKFERDLRGLATSEIPLAVTELAALAAAAAQGGVPETDLLDFTRMTAKAAVAWEVTGAVAGQNLANLRSALRLSNKDLGLFADAINYVSDNTASSAPDLVDFSKRVAAQGEFFGFAKEQALAFGAAMIGAGAESNVAATSFRNMGRALTRGSSASKAQQRAYEKLGLNSSRVAKTMQKDAVGMTLNVMKRIGKLPAYMQGSVISDLFGDEARALAPLLGKLEILTDALGLVGDKTKYAGSVEKEFANRAATTEYALQRFQSRVREVGLVVGGSLLPPLKHALDVLGPLALRFAKLAEKYPGLTRAVTLTAAGLVGLRIAGFAAAFGLRWMWGGALAVAKGAMLGLAGAVRVASIALMPFGAAFRAARSAIMATRTAILAFAVSAAMLGTGGALRAAAASIFSMATAMRVLKFAVIGTGIGAALVGLAAAGTWIYNNWSGIKALFAGIGEGLMAGLAPVMPTIQPIIDGFNWLSNTLSSIFGPIDASKEGWRSLGVTIGTSIGGAITSVIEKIKSLIGWITSVPGKIAGMLGFGGSGKTPAAAAATVAAPAIAGARAAGGPVRAGSAYLVGENGPEIFRARANGAISNTLDTVRAIKAQAMAGAAKAGGGAAVTNVGGVTINVQASPGQSPEAIAAAVEKQLSSKLNALSRGAYSDGVY